MTFTELPGLGVLGNRNAPLGPEKKLALFAWSRDSLPVKVEFSDLKIMPLQEETP